MNLYQGKNEPQLLCNTLLQGTFPGEAKRQLQHQNRDEGENLLLDIDDYPNWGHSFERLKFDSANPSYCKHKAFL